MKTDLKPLILFCSLIIFPYGLAHSFPVARLKGVRPVVQLRSTRGTALWSLARERQTLSFGNTIRTGAAGRAEVIFNNGTQLAMRANTQIEIVAPPSASQPLIVRVTGALSEVFVRARGKTEIRTAAGTAAVRGTQYIVRLTAENTTELTVSEGSVDFYNPQGAVLVAAGQQSTAQVGTAPAAPVKVDASGLFAWTADITALPLEWEVAPDAQSTPEFRLGLQLRAQGRNREALTSFAAAYEQSHDGQTLAGQMLGLLDTGNRKAARELYDAAPAAAKNDADALALAGVTALYESDAAKAESLLRSALAQKPNFYQAQSALALALLTRNEIADSIASARRAVGLAPRSAQAQSTLAMALFFDGRNREAAKAARLATELNPLSPLALLTYGRAMLTIGNNAEALQALGQAQALVPGLPILQSELGDAFLRLDAPRRAEESYRAALAATATGADATDVASVAPLVGLGAALGAQGKNAQARASFENALRLAPDNDNARARFAAFLIESGDLTEAQKLLADSGVLSAANSAVDGALFIRLSELSLYRQDLRNAFNYARRAVQLLPASSPAHYQLGRVLLEQDRIIQAESQFRLATILDRDNAAARYALGFTRRQTERGLLAGSRDILGAVELGGPSSSLTLQNLQTPGAEDRIQAAIQDPTVVRIASRSYGDTQLDGRIGESGEQDLAISHLKEFDGRRGLYGASARRKSADGSRANADNTSSRASLMLGRKKNDSPSAVFLLGEFEHQKVGADTGLDSLPAAHNSRFRYTLPRLIAGVNIQTNQDSRTRIVVQASQFDAASTDRVVDTRVTFKDDSLDFEIRHDRRVGDRQQLTAGLSVGRRKREAASFQTVPIPLQDLSNTRLAASVAYLRNEVRLNDQLSLTGEMRLQSLRFITGASVAQPLQLVFPETIAKTTAGIPKIVVSYRPDARSNYRLRVRRVVGGVQDFQLLTPNDSFSLDASDLPQTDSIDPLGSGRSMELEHNRTFSDASFLRLTVFQQDLKNLFLSGPGAEARVRGARASYEGLLGRDVAFFVRNEINSARTLNTSFVRLVPKFVGATGMQYLDRRGFFAQSVFVYQSKRDSGIGTRLGGFGVLNLRAGKRRGLRLELFIELNNVFDKRYDVLRSGRGTLQTGRQLIVGVSRRF